MKSKLKDSELFENILSVEEFKKEENFERKAKVFENVPDIDTSRYSQQDKQKLI